jgi:hypothetical protein
MRLAAFMALGAALCASPAAAAQWMSCTDAVGEASFDYFIADGAEFSVSAITVTAGERVWASDPANGPGDPIRVGNVYDDVTLSFVDATDELLNKVAELKVFKITEADNTVYGGTLRIVGVGAWVVSCAPTS